MAADVLGRQQKQADLCVIEASLLYIHPGAALRPHLKTKPEKNDKKTKTNKNN